MKIQDFYDTLCHSAKWKSSWELVDGTFRPYVLVFVDHTCITSLIPSMASSCNVCGRNNNAVNTDLAPSAGYSSEMFGLLFHMNAFHFVGCLRVFYEVQE